MKGGLETSVSRRTGKRLFAHFLSGQVLHLHRTRALERVPRHRVQTMPTRASRSEESWHDSQRDPCKQRHHNRPSLTPGLEDCGYLANVYPKEHARWRCEGRLLVFCAESSGLGSFMLAFPAAVVANIDRTCTDPRVPVRPPGSWNLQQDWTVLSWRQQHRLEC